MGDAEVMIKVAADIAAAVDALGQINESLKTVVEGIAAVGKKSEDDEPKVKGFWQTFAEGCGLSGAAAVAAGTQISQSFDKLKDGVLGAATALPNLIKGVANAGDELLTMSNRLGVPVETLSELQFVSDTTGVSMESMARQIQGLSTITKDLAGKPAMALQKMGMNLKELANKDQADAFFDIIENIKKTGTAAEQNAKMMEIFGGKARGMTGLLRENVTELREQAKSLGGMNQELAEQGDRYGDAMAAIKRSQESFRNDVASIFLPAVNSVLEAMPNLGGAVLTLGEGMWEASKAALPLISNVAVLAGPKGLKGLYDSFIALGPQMSKFIKEGLVGMTSGITKVLPFMKTLNAEFLKMGTIMSLSLGWWLAIGAAVVALGVILYNALGGWEGILGIIKEVADFFMDLGVIIKEWVIDSFEHASKSITIFLAYIKQMPIVGTIIKGITAYFKMWYDLVVKLWGYIKSFFSWLGKTVDEVADGYREANKEQQKSADIALEQEKNLSPLAERLAEIKKQQQQYREELKLIGPESAAQMIYLKKFGESVARIAQLFNLSEGAANLFFQNVETAKTTGIGKLTESVKEFGKSWKEANASGADANQVLEKMGANAYGLIKQAELLKGGWAKLSPEVKKLGLEWEAMELEKKTKAYNETLKALNKTSEELAKTWSDQVKAGAKTAMDAVQDMTDEMVTSMMKPQEAAIYSLNRAEEKAIEAVNDTRYAQEKALEDQLKSIEANAKQRRDLEERQKEFGEKLTAEDLARLKQVEDAEIAAAMLKFEANSESYAKQLETIRKFYAAKRGIELQATGDWEKDLQLMGVRTQAVYKEDLRLAEERLRKMREAQAAGIELAAGEVEAQEEKIRLMKEADTLLGRLGIKTEAQQKRTLRLEREKLEVMRMYAKEVGPAAIAAQQAIVDAAEAAAGKVTTDWLKMSQNVAGSFQTLAQIGGESMNAIARAMGTATQSGAMMKEGFGTVFGKRGADGKFTGGMFSMKDGKRVMDWGKAVQGGTQMAGAAIQGWQSIQAATDTLSTGKNIAGGAMAGMQAGMAFGPWGAAVGAGVGAIVGAFKNKDAMKARKEVAKDMGVEITEELAKSMQDTGNKKFGGGQSGRWAAEVFHLGDIIKEAGGVTAENFEGMSKQFDQGLRFLDNGTYDLKEFQEMAASSFPAIAAHVAKTGGVWTGTFQGIITELRRTGVEVEGFKELIDSQLGAATAGSIKIVAKLFQGLPEDIKTNNAALAKVRADRQDDFDRASRLTLATFNAYQKEGRSAVESIGALGEAIDGLKIAQTELGFTGNEAFNQLSRMRDLITANQPTLDAIGGVNEMMAALGNLGALNAETFSDMQTELADSYATLTAGGFSEAEALAQIAPALETVRDLHKEKNLAVDAGTQALIDQADAAGLMKDEMTDNEKMVAGLDRATDSVERLGGMLAGVFGVEFPKAALAASDATKGLANSVNGLNQGIQNTDFTSGFEDLTKAANDAGEAVDGVSLGHSPGGIKEIAIQMKYAEEAARVWKMKFIHDMEEAAKAVEELPQAQLEDFAIQQEEAMKPVTEASDTMGPVHENLLDLLDQSMRTMQPVPTEADAKVVNFNYHGPDADGWRRLMRGRDFQRELLGSIDDNAGDFRPKLQDAIDPSRRGAVRTATGQ